MSDLLFGEWEVAGCEAVVFSQLDCCPPPMLLVRDLDSLVSEVRDVSDGNEESVEMLLSGNSVPLLDLLDVAKV